MENIPEVCAPGTAISEDWLPASPGVFLRMIPFSPPQKTGNPDVVFVAEWASKPVDWREVLREITRDFWVFILRRAEKFLPEFKKTSASVSKTSAGISFDLSHSKEMVRVVRKLFMK